MMETLWYETPIFSTMLLSYLLHALLFRFSQSGWLTTFQTGAEDKNEASLGAESKL